MGYRTVEVAVGYPVSARAIEDALQRYAPDAPREHEGRKAPLEMLANSCLRAMGVKALVNKIYPPDDEEYRETPYFVAVRRRAYKPYEMPGASLLEESTASREVKKAFDIEGGLRMYMLA